MRTYTDTSVVYTTFLIVCTIMHYLVSLFLLLLLLSFLRGLMWSFPTNGATNNTHGCNPLVHQWNVTAKTERNNQKSPENLLFWIWNKGSAQEAHKSRQMNSPFYHLPPSVQLFQSKNWIPFYLNNRPDDERRNANKNIFHEKKQQTQTNKHKR